MPVCERGAKFYVYIIYVHARVDRQRQRTGAFCAHVRFVNITDCVE